MITAARTFKRSVFWQAMHRATVVWADAGVIAFLLIVVLGKSNLFGLTQRVALAVAARAATHPPQPSQEVGV